MQGLPRRRHIAFRGDRGFAVISTERDVRNRSGGGDSRLLPDGFQQAIDDADSIPSKVPREGAFAGENMIGAKAGRDRHHLFQAQSEQRRTCEQDKSEGDLRDDEAVAKTLSGATDRAGARFRLERIREMAAEIEPGDRHRDDDAQDNRADQAERRQPAIERDLRAERQTIRTENLEQLSSPRADEDAEQSAARGEENGFESRLA